MTKMNKLVEPGALKKSAMLTETELRRAALAKVADQGRPGSGSFAVDRHYADAQLVEFTVPIGGAPVKVKRGENAIVIAGVEIRLGQLAPEVRRQFELATSRLDGAALAAESDLLAVRAAREQIIAAVTAVMSSRAFLDRVVVAGTRCVRS
ncbi:MULTISPECIES: hypothetical protein [Bradyrhizobium]|uniref:hypothetical protein n=1 Tax=Bradyrhizobium TaxID=374 RepID=UPI00155E4E3C|nr:MULTISPECIES: hypothetical protein [Bradyrhizobium]MDD1522624.1 hypothetical protein [Bradyrhizobium sp. WBAH30]MDD1546186.1 hypothetical protein [Bradyrhizobium sp. WBAH41]MDD1560066.1 hypothetical protein [Bradyrhizobium sp. WBAH23]MDD1567168.1 hypothetical protein [Bradyrhizobium sp. WBAH33]MDD1593476.1 hypothetical protein [Bradyrhizobium sp. WBAH42]